MIPNVWLMDEEKENPKNNTENLKLETTGNVNSRLVQNKQLPLKNNPLEMVQEGKKN